jgi:hypothetical protein
VFQRSTAGAAWPKALGPLAPPPASKTRPCTCILGGIPRIVLSEHDNCQSTPSVSIIRHRHLFDRVGEQLLLAFRLAFLERWFVGSRRGESATVYQPPTKERQSEDDVGGRCQVHTCGNQASLPAAKCLNRQETEKRWKTAQPIQTPVSTHAEIGPCLFVRSFELLVELTEPSAVHALSSRPGRSIGLLVYDNRSWPRFRTPSGMQRHRQS